VLETVINDETIVIASDKILRDLKRKRQEKGVMLALEA